MALEPALHLVVEILQHWAANHVSSGGLCSTDHQLQPVGRCNLVVIDHQKIDGSRKRRQRGLKRGIDRMAIALPWLDYAETRKPAGSQKFSGDRHAAARRSIVLDDHDREAAIGALIG